MIKNAAVAVFALLATVAFAFSGVALVAQAKKTKVKATTKIAGCPVFPANNPWNKDVSKLPVNANSAAYIQSIGLGDHLHADFGSGRYGDYGIPFKVVSRKQKKVPINFTAYGDESDKGPYPIPSNARVEGGGKGDSHVLILQKGSCKLYEMYGSKKSGNGWNADSGAVFNLKSNRLRTAGWTSADAAGLPILPGLARADEVKRGKITHALRFTVSRTQAGYVSPARHKASSDNNPALPPMGLRLRMKANFDISGYKGQARVILVALKRYGMIVADNGSDWYISGTPDRRWNDDDLDQLKTISGSAFEAVETGPIRK